MTSPSPFGPSRDDALTKANWLGRYLDVESGYEKRISEVLADAADSIDSTFEKLVPKNFSETVKRSQLALVSKAIRDKVKGIFGETGDIIRDGRQDAAVAAVNAGLYDQKSILSQMFPNSVDRSQYADSLRQTAKRNIDATLTRVLESERPLSEKVYHSAAIANGQVSQAINRALARGDSAADLAKSVKDLIRPDVPGGVSYAAKRLARTEINNAFHAQSIHDAQEQPWIKQMEWHLSKTHKEIHCVCETYALQRFFDKERVPGKPHPQCRCFVTGVSNDYDEFENALVSGQYDSYIDSVIDGVKRDEVTGAYSISAPEEPPTAEPQIKNIKWDGPKVAKPVENTLANLTDDEYETDADIHNSSVIDDIDQVWSSTEFDAFKNPIREGARIAQQHGYSGMDAKLREHISELQEDTPYTTGPDPGDRSEELLQQYGKEIVSRAVHDPNITESVYRGLQLNSKMSSGLVEGQRLSMPLSSFSDDADFAQGFATGENWVSMDAPELDSNPVVMELLPGAKTARMSGGEHVAFGQFEVTEVGDDPINGFKHVKIQQLSMKEAATEGKFSTGGEVGDGDIPEIELIDPPDAAFGPIRSKADQAKNKKNRVKLEAALPNSRIVGYEDPGIDPKATSVFTNAVIKLSEKYPMAAKHVRSIGFGELDRSNAYGHTLESIDETVPELQRAGGVPSAHMLLNIEKAQDVSKTGREQERFRRDVDSGFHSSTLNNDVIEYNAVHEFGHVIQNMFAGREKMTWKNASSYLEDAHSRTHPPEERNLENFKDWIEKSLSGYSFRTNSVGEGIRDVEYIYFSEALSEAFAAVELGGGNVAEKALHEFIVDSYKEFF